MEQVGAWLFENRVCLHTLWQIAGVVTVIVYPHIVDPRSSSLIGDDSTKSHTITTESNAADHASAMISLTQSENQNFTPL